MLAGVQVYVLDTSQAWLENTPILQTVKVSRNIRHYNWRGSTVFDMSSLSIRDRISFAQMLCSTIYIKHVNGYKTPEFIVFEEAQTYLPNGCLRSPQKYGAVLDVISQGRNYNIRFGLLTQFPSNVDKYPVKMTEQRYFGWTWERNDVNYIKALVGKRWAETLKSLDVGEFIYQRKNRLERISVPEYGQQQKQVGNVYCSYVWRW